MIGGCYGLQVHSNTYNSVMFPSHDRRQIQILLKVSYSCFGFGRGIIISFGSTFNGCGGFTQNASKHNRIISIAADRDWETFNNI